MCNTLLQTKSIMKPPTKGITKYAKRTLIKLVPMLNDWIGPTKPTIPNPADCGVP